MQDAQLHALYIVGGALQEAQIMVLQETPSKVLGTRGSNRPNFKLFSLFVPPKILKKLLKKALIGKHIP